MKLNTISTRSLSVVPALAAMLLLGGCDKSPAPSSDTTSNMSAPAPAESAPVAPAPAGPPVAELPAPVAQSASSSGPRQVVDQYADYEPPAAQEVVSIYDDPMLTQPPPIAVNWAPPPMLVEAPPPQPYPDARWTGGYWVWHGDWVWAHGRWARPPRPNYAWTPPYYEHRSGVVLFIDGFWRAPNVVFVAPPLDLKLSLAEVRSGAVHGPAPMGPEGVFVPPPPGSRHGLIVPAPLGTPPAVVTSAPPIIRDGMRVTNVVNNRTTVNNVTNITNVTIVAPAAATATHQQVNIAVPAQAHLAAAQTAMVRASAPNPVPGKPLPTFVPGHALAALPPSQTVRAEVPAELQKHRVAEASKAHSGPVQAEGTGTQSREAESPMRNKAMEQSPRPNAERPNAESRPAPGAGRENHVEARPPPPGEAHPAPTKEVQRPTPPAPHPAVAAAEHKPAPIPEAKGTKPGEKPAQGHPEIERRPGREERKEQEKKD